MQIMKKSLLRIIIVTLLSAFGSLAEAQTNLLPQPGFENFITCPNSLSDIAESYWDKAPSHSGSSDYFHSCATSTACDVPNNIFGSSFANSGQAYAGGYCGLSPGSTYREYIFDTLSQTLVSGVKYVVSFHYRLASNARFSSSDLGFYLSSTPPTGTGTGNLGVTPTSWNPSGAQLQNNTSWALYTDTIVATGGEQYITIGAFTANPTTVLYNTSASIGGAYYYFDDASVILHEGVGGDTNICLGDSGQVYAIELDSVTWRDSLAPTVVISTQDTITVSPTVTTTYMAVVPGDTYYFTVNVINPISGFLGNDTIICEGETVTKVVDLPNPYTFDWSDGGTDSALITQDSGEFTLEVTLHGCVSADTFHIAYYFFPDYDLGPDLTICWYDSTVLDPNVTGGTVNSYTWSTGESTPTITVQNTGIYWVDLTNDDCTMRDSIEISYHPTVVVDLGPDQEFCYSASEALVPNALNASSFLWSNGANTPTTNVTTSGMYHVTATGNGCNAYDSVQYTFYYDPFFNLPETLKYCDYDTAIISTGLDPAGLSFVWNTGVSTPTISIAGGSQGNYWVQVEGEHCTMRDTVYVEMYPPINLELGEDIPICEGDSVKITPNTDPLFDYNWSTGTNANEITVTESGVFTLTVTNGFCTEVDKIRVFVYKYPKINLGDDITLCAPTELNFDVTTIWNAVTFNWYDGTTTPNHIMFADEDQSIWVRATNYICSTTDTLNIHLATPPSIELIDDTILCENRTARIKAEGNPNWSYTWSNGDTSQVLATSVGGHYEISVYDGTCTTVDSVRVHDLSNPDLDILGPEYICLGEIEVLDAEVDGAYLYKWQDGSNLSSLHITEPGEYSVEVSHKCGVARDTIMVTDCECFVRFPTAFRPTPSGVNKTFGPVIDCDIIQYKLRVFNRWGETLFYTEDASQGWDGYINQDLAPVGSYGWKCEYKGLYDGEKILRNEQGSVMLLR
ncbi:MAG: gliding motility-associated C-terminal domain-containing protein [Cryomorphaceae bacterium]